MNPNSHGRIACLSFSSFRPSSSSPRPCKALLLLLDVLKFAFPVQLLYRARLPIALPPALLSRVPVRAVVPKHIALAVDLQPGGTIRPVLGGAARANASVARPDGHADPGPGVVARRGAPVGHVEAPVEAARCVQVYDDELDEEVEAVEARLGLVPRRVRDGPGRGEVHADAEAGAQRQDERGEDQQGEFRPVPADAEFLRAWLGPREEDGEDGDGDGEEGEDGAGEVS